jgi:hypothetical protein
MSFVKIPVDEIFGGHRMNLNGKDIRREGMGDNVRVMLYCAHYGGTEHGKNKAVENLKNKIAKMIFD